MRKIYNYLTVIILLLCSLFLISCNKSNDEKDYEEIKIFFLDNTTKYYAPVFPGYSTDKLIIPVVSKGNISTADPPVLLDTIGENLSGLDFSIKKYSDIGVVDIEEERYLITHFELSFTTNSAYEYSSNERKISSIKLSFIDKEYTVPVNIHLQDIKYSESVGNVYLSSDTSTYCFLANESNVFLQCSWQPDSWDYLSGGYCNLNNIYFAHDMYEIDIVEFKMLHFYNHPAEIEYYSLNIDCLSDMDYQHSNEMHIIEADLNQKNNIPYTGDYLKIEFQPYDYDESVTVVQRMYTKMDVKMMEEKVKEYLLNNK